MIENFKNFLKTAPLKTILLLILGWFLMVLLNYYLNEHHFFTGTRITFPISVVYFSIFSLQGIFFSFIFLAFGLYNLYHFEKLNSKMLFLVYSFAIIFGNLAQGSLHQTFLRSFIDTDFQYYHDVIKISNGFDFISSYNDIQESLTMHAKTHPPFAVWIQYVLYKITNQSVLGLAIGMSIIGLFAYFPLIKILDFFNSNSNNKLTQQQ